MWQNQAFVPLSPSRWQWRPSSLVLRGCCCLLWMSWVLTTKRIFSETPGTLLCRNISVRIIVQNQNRTGQFRVCSISACLVYSAAGLSLSIRITPEEDWRLEIIYLSCISTWKMHLKCGVAKLIFSHCEESERDCFLPVSGPQSELRTS